MVSFAFRITPAWLDRDSTVWTYRFHDIIADTEVTPRVRGDRSVRASLDA